MAYASKQTVWNYLINCGFNKAATAGIMGNMEAESSFNLAAVGDSGTSFGLCQWHLGRGSNMKSFCASHGGSWESNTTGQLGYLMLELTDPDYMRDATLGVDLRGLLKKVPDNDSGIRQASDLWLKHFERPTDQSTSVQVTRYKYGKTIYDQLAGTSPSPSSKPQTTTIGKAILAIAQTQVGTKENGENNIKYNQYYIEKGETWLKGAAYCTTFLRWCANEAGIDLTKYGYNASCGTWVENAKANKTWVSTSQLQAGDILFFDWGHVGIIESVGSEFHTIEGNTPNPDGSGEGVFRKTRSKSVVLGGTRLDGTTTAPVNGGAASNSTAASGINYSVEYKEVTAEVKTSTILTADIEANALRTRANNLLASPTLVESPFIVLKIGDYTFGSYSIDGSFESVNSAVSVTYPNYMTSIKITKVNGQVNQYVITMVYQIRNGDDPNLLDKIFSSVGYGKVYISYGDWNTPKFTYKDEEAIITKLSTNVDFANSRITYNLYCTSNALVLMSGYTSFKAGTVKPSDEIFRIMYDPEYKLTEIFTAFADNKAFFRECVASDDVSVEVVAKTGIDPLSYINYLVTCMSPTSTPKNSPLRDANYYLTICEDREKGTYFTVKKVSSSEGIVSLNNSDVYEVDVGYPGDTMVTSFKLSNDNSWSLLYNYSQDINTNDYIYNVDADGNINSVYSPGITTSSRYLKTTETQRNWWTQMTQFPVTATLTIKGLLRPAMLMSYVRVNALFYGLRHVSSGLYIITKQVDTVDGNGYRTTLSLTRVAGDLDIIVTDTKTVTRQIPVKVASSTSSSYNYSNSGYDYAQEQVAPNNVTYQTSAAGFKPRLSSDGMQGSKWWYSSDNIFYASGWGLPNCTCYAYGRYAEIMGKFPSYARTVLNGNAEQFYRDASKDSNFSCGQTPKLGAIICWKCGNDSSGSDGAGHVGVVEAIDNNGDVTVSYSGYGSPYFATGKYTKSSGYYYSNNTGKSYQFQGFIYNPGVSSSSVSSGGGQNRPMTQ